MGKVLPIKPDHNFLNQPFHLVIGSCILIFASLGHYSVDSGRNEACLIYVTFDGRIYIYHNIKLAQVQTTSLIEALDNSETVRKFMEKFGKEG